MNRTSLILTCVLAVSAGAFPASVAGQGFLSGGAMLDPGAADAPDAHLYGDGMKAIRDSRWADAIKTFDRVAREKGQHAAGALYWRAYAENKQGHPDKALETCAALRQQFAGNGWIEDCGALSIEIQSSQGKPVQPKPSESDDLKLLALSTLMQKDPKRARAQIEEIVAGDSSERLKEGAVFILGRWVPESSYPQIVRVSYLEGDVRIARATQNQESDKAEWESAVMNLPIAQGDSLVTGDGRAEIEFEDASMLYVGPNSVLNFQDLHTTGGIPHSEVQLLSGTVTLHPDGIMPGETFVVKSPTNDFLARYPQKAGVRISSYLDGVALTFLTPHTFALPGAAKLQLAAGETAFFNAERRLVLAGAGGLQDMAAWDAWVADRYTARTSAMAEMMRASGLSSPIPGLAEMKDQGSFYDCAPYGKCWEPKASTRPLGEALASGTQPSTVHVQQPEPASAFSRPQTGAAAAPIEYFPCMPVSSWNWGSPTGVSMVNPFDWALCHAGAWIRRNNRYVWVAGVKRHHAPPVSWVKDGSTVAFVPVHPRDVKGTPPINREHGFVAEHVKSGYKVSEIRFDTTQRLDLVKSPPRQFRTGPLPSLPRAEAPRMVGHLLKEAPVLTPGASQPAGSSLSAGVPLQFDHRAQSFSAQRQILQNGRSVTVRTPVSSPAAASVQGRFAPAHSGGYHSAAPASASSRAPAPAPAAPAPSASPAPAAAPASHH